MKIQWNKELTAKTLSGIIIATVGLLVYFILSRFDIVIDIFSFIWKILSPFVGGIILAYFINFLLNFYESKLLKKIAKWKVKRVISVILSYVSALVILALIVFLIVPQTVESLTLLLNNIPGYLDNFSKILDQFAERFNVKINYNTILDAINAEASTLLQSNLTDILLPYMGNVLNITTSIASGLVNIIIAIIVSMYLIVKKEIYIAQSKKVFTALFGPTRTQKILKVGGMTDKIFTDFFVGKVVDSLIIGLICFIIMTIFGFPFATLISVIIGITNIIPLFGPFIGAIPSIFIIMIADPIMALWFILVILLLQTLDGYVIGPKIIGVSVGISGLWVIFAIIVFMKLFGFVGMVIGVPIFGVVFIMFKDFIEKRLDTKNLPSNTMEYVAEKATTPPQAKDKAKEKNQKKKDK